MIYHKTEYRERRDHFAFFACSEPVGRVRHVARRVPRAVPRLGPADRRRARDDVRLDRPRLAADRRAPGPARPRPGRDPRGRSSCSATPRTRSSAKFDPPGSADDRQAPRPADHRPLPRPGRRSTPRSRPCASAGTSCSASFQVDDRQRAPRPDGQRLERLPVHGDVQPVALGFAVRVRDRPRDGLPRLDPGPARLRPHGPRAGAPADPRPRRHAAADRRRVPPVPAADQARQRRRRLRLQRRPRLARARRSRPTSRRPATWRSSTSPSTVRQRAGHARSRSPSTSGGPSTTPSSGSARTACRSSAAPTGTTASTSTASPTRPGESFQTTQNREGGVAESVFIAGLFVARGERAGRDRRAARGSEPRASRLRAAAAQMVAAVDAHGWDGEWFRRAYDFFGEPIGSAANDEGQIFIEPQGICIMAGIGLEDGRAGQALAAGPGAPRDAARDRPPAARVLALSAAARRDLVVPARLQGERAGSSATPTRG